MDFEEIYDSLLEYHLILILGGALLCFISIFLPFWSLNNNSLSLLNTGNFWIFLILIMGIFVGYYLKIGETYPSLYLYIGVFLLLMTVISTQFIMGLPPTWRIFSRIDLSIGFYLELICSASISVGGYFYNSENS